MMTKYTKIIIYVPNIRENLFLYKEQANSLFIIMIKNPRRDLESVFLYFLYQAMRYQRNEAQKQTSVPRLRVILFMVIIHQQNSSRYLRKSSTKRIPAVTEKSQWEVQVKGENWTIQHKVPTLNCYISKIIYLFNTNSYELIDVFPNNTTREDGKYQVNSYIFT